MPINNINFVQIQILFLNNFTLELLLNWISLNFVASPVYFNRNTGYLQAIEGLPVLRKEYLFFPSLSFNWLWRSHIFISLTPWQHNVEPIIPLALLLSPHNNLGTCLTARYQRHISFSQYSVILVSCNSTNFNSNLKWRKKSSEYALWSSLLSLVCGLAYQ